MQGVHFPASGSNCRALASQRREEARAVEGEVCVEVLCRGVDVRGEVWGGGVQRCGEACIHLGVARDAALWRASDEKRHAVGRRSKGSEDGRAAEVALEKVSRGLVHKHGRHLR